jgi:membrane protease YdiL (CAAX protease family)
VRVVSARLAAVSVAVGGIVLLAAWLFEWPLEKAAMLAPILVVAGAAIAGLFVLWTRVALEQLRAAKRPRLIVAVGVAAILLIAILAILGVNLPREGGHGGGF